MSKDNEDWDQQINIPINWVENTVKHYTQEFTATVHHFYLTGYIEEEVDRYLDMINIMKTAETYDKIYVYLNNGGGDLSNTIQIISAMNQSPAEITTVLEGELASAGTFIFLAGHNYIVNDNCSFMIHNGSFAYDGKGGEVFRSAKYFEKYFKTLVEYFYTDFLTPKEIQAVCNDQDIWLSSEDVLERLKKRGVDVIEEESGFDPDFDNIINDVVENNVEEVEREPVKKSKNQTKKKASSKKS